VCTKRAAMVEVWLMPAITSGLILSVAGKVPVAVGVKAWHASLHNACNKSQDSVAILHKFTPWSPMSPHS